MKRTQDIPRWVYYGLLGTSTRGAAVQMLVFMLVMTAVAVGGAVVSGKYYLLVTLIPTAWHWLALNWVDNNSAWDK